MKSQDTEFSQRMRILQSRVRRLYRNVEAVPTEQTAEVKDNLEELNSAIEELTVVEDALLQQNQELLAAQQVLATERQRYQDLFEFAPDGYLVTDSSGRILEANRASALLLNCDPAYLIGKTIVAFVPHTHLRSFHRMLEKLPSLGRLEEWEGCFSRVGAGLFEAALTIELVKDRNHQPAALRWLIRDITSRKQVEAQIHQTQMQNLELVEADRMKIQFLGMLSHELRTPMNSILGFSQLLLNQFRKQGDPKVVTMTERIFSNGQHLLQMIEEMLEHSKLYSHRVELHCAPLDLRELATTTADEMQVLAQQKGLVLSVQVPESPLIMQSDRGRIRQICMNLLSNAIKFTESGSVTIKVDTLPGDLVLIQVQDTGIGIPKQDQAHIFKEFWQVNQTVTRTHSGTGLGLSIVKKLVDLMQGTILVESQVGRGTTFQIALPCQHKKTTVEEPLTIIR